MKMSAALSFPALLLKLGALVLLAPLVGAYVLLLLPLLLLGVGRQSSAAPPPDLLLLLELLHSVGIIDVDGATDGSLDGDEDGGSD